MNKINEAITKLKEILKTEKVTITNNDGTKIITNNHQTLISALRSLELIK